MMKPITSLMLSVAIGLTSAPMAAAKCVDAFMTGLNNYKAGAHRNQGEFRINEMLVICFTPRDSGQIAIFDSPADGAYEQLYPNAWTHPKGDTYIEVTANQQQCLGLEDTFPMYHPPDEGTGTGKISFAFTRSAGNQLSEGDFVQLGVVARSTMESHLRSFPEAGGACGDREVVYLHYKVVQ